MYLYLMYCFTVVLTFYAVFFSHNLTALKHKMAEFQLILGGTLWLFSGVILCVTGVGDSFMYE